MNGTIEVVLCKRDSLGFAIPGTSQSVKTYHGNNEWLGRQLSRMVTKGVRDPYKGQAEDRFFCEGDFAIGVNE